MWSSHLRANNTWICMCFTIVVSILYYSSNLCHSAIYTIDETLCFNTSWWGISPKTAYKPHSVVTHYLTTQVFSNWFWTECCPSSTNYIGHMMLLLIESYMRFTQHVYNVLWYQSTNITIATKIQAHNFK